MRRARAVGAAVLLCVAVAASCTSSPGPSRPTAASPTNTNKKFTPIGWATHCAPVGARRDDPIRAFGRPGASPANEFWGALGGSASSTFASLEGTQSSCSTRLDSSIFWAPELLSGGRVVKPDGLFAYFETPRDAEAASIEPFPAGFKMDGTHVRWSCAHGGAPKRPEPFDCTPYGKDHFVDAWVYFPSCWDGSTPDVVYPVDRRCPAGYTVRLPALTVQTLWPGLLDGEGVTLSTGGPNTFHAGFLNAWRPDAMAKLTQACLNYQQRCGAVVNFFHRIREGSPVPGPPVSVEPTP
jgi:hypothetical protein